MRFPEYLYQLSARDQRVTWLDPQINEASGTAAALNVTASFSPVPTGRILLLSAACVRGSGGGAQTVNDMTIELVNPTDTTNFIIAGSTPVANIGYATFSGEIVVPPGYILRTSGNFSAAVAANTIVLAIFGMFVPIGNIQRV